MNKFQFTLQVKDFFKLSTGTTAIVGEMNPSDYPVITPDDYEVKMINSNGVSHIFTNISEDIFARRQLKVANKYRSLQTTDNIDNFLSCNKENIILQGFNKVLL